MIDAKPLRYLPNLQSQVNEIENLKGNVDCMQIKITQALKGGAGNSEQSKQDQTNMKLQVNTMIKDFDLMKKVYTCQRMDELEQTVKRFSSMED